MIAYDPVNKRLAMFTHEATPEFWDEQWNKEELLKNITAGNTYHFLKRITTKYVPSGGRILEGGCGTGQVVYAMNTWGYEAHGVDYAKKTIEAVKEIVPELRVQVGDVRQIPFPDDSFDGYWSLGVIEHFWDGFSPITQEAARVLRPDGHLFLTFPWMSPLRRWKARRGLYPKLDASHDPATFYEFMLDKHAVVRALEAQGFTCVQTYAYDAVKGLKDDLPFLHKPLARLYASRSTLARAFRYLLTLILARLTGHMILLVCKKSSHV